MLDLIDASVRESLIHTVLKFLLDFASFFPWTTV